MQRIDHLSVTKSTKYSRKTTHSDVRRRFVECQQHVTIPSAVWISRSNLKYHRFQLMQQHRTLMRLNTLNLTYGNQTFTFINVSTAPFAVSSIVVPIYVRWFIDALVSTRNTIIVILTVLQSAITNKHVYRVKESLKGLIRSKKHDEIGPSSPNDPPTTAAFQQLKTVVDISVTWYVRHGFAIGRGKSRGNNVCNVAHKYANRVVVWLPTRSNDAVWFALTTLCHASLPLLYEC